MKRLFSSKGRSFRLESCSYQKLWLKLDASSSPPRTQCETLRGLSEQLVEMTEELLVEIEVGRERARSLIAEFTGLFERAADVVSILLDFDEHFGGTSARRPRAAHLARKLETSLCYLVGVLSAIDASDELSFLDWTNLKSDVDSVWKTGRAILNLEAGTTSLAA